MSERTHEAQSQCCGYAGDPGASAPRCESYEGHPGGCFIRPFRAPESAASAVAQATRLGEQISDVPDMGIP